MPASRLDALVLDVDARAGLCIARTLGRAGLAVGVGSRDGLAPGLRTRYAARRVVLPEPDEDFTAYARALLAEVERNPVDAVLPSIDVSVEALHRHREELGRRTAPAVGAPAALEVARDKAATIAVASELGIASPRSLPVSSPSEVEAAAAEVGLPCVLKPLASWRELGGGGERVGPVYLADPDEAGRAAAALVRLDAPALVQELATGRRETVKLFRAGGRVLAQLTMVVERSWPPLGGSSSMRRTIAPPEDTLAAAELLVSEIGLDGYSEVEFRRDVRGRPLLMEVNARLSQSIEVAVRAGVDFARMQLEWARGGRIPATTRSALGLRVGWLGGDLRLLAGALAGSPPPRPALVPTLRAVAADYTVGRARLDGFDARDPAPTLASLALAARSLRGGAVRSP